MFLPVSTTDVRFRDAIPAH